MSGALLQFAGSLIAILVLAWIAARLRLGNDASIQNADHARDIANEVEHGFCPVDAAVSRSGEAALLRDARGRVLVLKKHGAHFAGRILTPGATARIDGEKLVLDTGEKRYGTVTLDLDEGASAWVQAVSAIGTSHDA